MIELWVRDRKVAGLWFDSQSGNALLERHFALTIGVK